MNAAKTNNERVSKKTIGIAMTCVILMFTSVAGAEDHVWSSWNGGLFNHWLNWVPQYVPGEDDNAIFEEGMEPNDIYFGEAVTNQQCIFRTTEIYMDLGGFTYTLNDPLYGLIVGENTGHVAEVLLWDGTIDTASAYVGLWDDSYGLLHLEYGLTMNLSGTLTVGHDGDGVVNIWEGASVTTEYSTIGGHDFGNTGAINLEGPDAEFTVNHVLTVGQETQGTLDVTNGATAYATHATLGGGSTGTGTINVVFYDSTFTADQLSLGLEGGGTLNVEYGGQVSAGSIIRVGWSPSGTGDVTVTGEDSAVSSDGYFSVGDQGFGTMSILDGAAASAQSFIVGWIGTATGELTLSDLGSTLTAASFTVGHDGDGTASIGQQAALTAEMLSVGHNGPGVGELNVVDAGTTVTVQNSIRVGERGTGTMNITNGADVRSTEPGGWISIGDQADSNGTVLVDGGSALTAEQAPIIVGGGGQASLTISGGSEVYSSGELFMGGATGSIGQLTISGVGSQYLSDSVYPSRVGDAGEGTLTIENGGYFENHAGFFLGDNATGVGTVTLNGAGSIFKTERLTVGEYGAGTINVNDGRVSLGVEDPSTIPSGEMHIAGAGNLAGTGTISGDVVNINSEVKPGGGEEAALTGVLTIDGDYTQQYATLRIKIKGTVSGDEYSVLNVSGAANLDHDLALDLISGYFPLPGEQYVVLTAGSINGTFGRVTGPGLYDVTYNANNVTVTVLKSPADLDGDDDVDLSDLAALLASFGTTSGATYEQGDIDGDGDVDLADLAVLLSLFGTGV